MKCPLPKSFLAAGLVLRTEVLNCLAPAVTSPIEPGNSQLQFVNLGDQVSVCQVQPASRDPQLLELQTEVRNAPVQLSNSRLQPTNKKVGRGKFRLQLGKPKVEPWNPRPQLGIFQTEKSKLNPEHFQGFTRFLPAARLTAVPT